MSLAQRRSAARVDGRGARRRRDDTREIQIQQREDWREGRLGRNGEERGRKEEREKAVNEGEKERESERVYVLGA